MLHNIERNYVLHVPYRVKKKKKHLKIVLGVVKMNKLKQLLLIFVINNGHYFIKGF